MTPWDLFIGVTRLLLGLAGDVVSYTPAGVPVGAAAVCLGCWVWLYLFVKRPGFC